MTADQLSANPNLLAPGSMIVVPLDMSIVQMTQITLQQMSNTQDFSMRAWISQFQNGIPLGSGLYYLLKFAGLPIIVHVASQTPPASTFPVLVDPTSYYVNILNLTNEANFFGFSQTNLA